MTEKDLKACASDLIEKYTQIESRIEKSLSNSTAETLRISRRDGKQYYSVLVNDPNGTLTHKYISKKDKKTLSRLAQRKYNLAILPLVKENIRLLEQFLRDYHFGCLEKEYLALEKAGDYTLKPYHTRVDDIIERWMSETCPESNVHPENKIYQTDNGEMVRSKSEVIIANALHRNSDTLLYKYERPLTLTINGHKKVRYPDFTVLNKNTGKISYWEHFGRLDDPEYASESFVAKMDEYEEAGLELGVNFFITYESSDYPLNIKSVNRVIAKMI